MANNIVIKLENISKSYPAADQVLADITFEIKQGECLTLFGPNGSGKSTLLNIIAGLDRETGGSIIGREELLINRSIGYLFQDYRKSLFPWLTVRENILLPLTFKHYSRKQAEQKLSELLAIVNLPLRLDDRVTSLSGGEAQLVSLLRALIIKPKLLLLDEPFAAIDYNRTLELRDLVRTLTKTFQIATLFVSHDLDEALYVGDKIAFLSPSPARIKEILVPSFSTLTDENSSRSSALLGTPEFAMAKKTALEILKQQTRITSY